MALKSLLLRKELDTLHMRMTALSDKLPDYDARAAELETALNEAATDEDISAVRELITDFDAERANHQNKVDELQAQIDAKEAELRDLQSAAPPANAPAVRANVRNEVSAMPFRALAYLSPERRERFLNSPDVNAFVDSFRDKFRGASGKQSRAVSGADLLIPEVVLEVLRENIDNYSKLIKYVRLVPLNGSARMPVMGAIPEAVWTEAVGALNEIYLTVGHVEMDGFKVGAYSAIGNATLEDTNPVLANEIIYALGVSIGKAVDKAILFGSGVKMPLGFVTRLAQTAEPSDYPADARPWENLSQSNVITIPANTHGIALFQAIATAFGSAKSDYSDGRFFWAVSDITKTTLVSEALSINASGAIVTGIGNTMPVLGGDIVTLPHDVVPDGAIYGGYGNLYTLGERKGMTVGYSDQPFFLQDQTAFKATARYDGKAAIPEGFLAIGLNGAAPATSTSFNPDVANTPNPSLRVLAVGGLALTPAFASSTTSYTASTSNAADVINFIPATGATARVSVGGKKVQPGTPVKWASGENAVSIVVTSGGATQTYTVTVTKA